MLHRVSVKYYGKASHAAAYPWEGVNALDAAVLAYNNISVLRQQLRPQWRFHGELQAETVIVGLFTDAPMMMKRMAIVVFVLFASMTHNSLHIIKTTSDTPLKKD